MPYQYIYIRSQESLADWEYSTPFNMSLPVDDDWVASLKHKSSNGLDFNKALVVLESVPSKDLGWQAKSKEKGRATKLLSDNDSREVVLTVLDKAMEHAHKYDREVDASSWRFAFLNYNFARWYNLKQEKQNLAAIIQEAHKRAVKRVKAYVKILKPDLIIVLGYKAASSLSGDSITHADSGTLFSLDGTRAVSSLDIDMLGRDGAEGNSVNLHGRVMREIANGFLDKRAHDLGTLKPNASLVDTPKKFKAMMAKLERAEDGIGFDIETTGLDTYANTILTMQFAPTPEVAYVLPIHHKDTPWSRAQLESIRGRLRKFFARDFSWYDGFVDGEQCRFLIGHNIGFDMRITQRWLNVPYCKWPLWDIPAGEFLLDENGITMKLIGHDTAMRLSGVLSSYGNSFYSTAKFSKADRTTIASVDLSKQVLEYCAMDAQAVKAIQTEQLLRAEALGYAKFKRFALVHMSSMVRVAWTMEARGTRVDLNYLVDMMKPDSEVVGAIDGIKAEMNKLPEVKRAMKVIGGKANRGRRTVFDSMYDFSPKFDPGKMTHKEALFIDVLKLEPISKTKKGRKPSFDNKFFAAYAEEHEAARLMSELRKMEKIRGTYINGFYKHLSRKPDARADHRIRSNFGYVNTVTGRSNSSDPSFQQIPEHGKLAKIIKRSLVTPPRTLHYEADYSAHEVRSWGILSEDGNLESVMHEAHKYIVQFRHDPTDKNFRLMQERSDLHKQNYSAFTGTPIGKIDRPQRQIAKGLVFGLVYGMGPESMANRIGQSLDETKRIINRFFRKYPKGQKWLSDTVTMAERDLFVESPLGRRRNLPGLVSTNRGVRTALERKAKNSIVQGFASDVCFLAADLFARELDRCLDELGMVSSMDAPEIDMDMRDAQYLPPGANAIVHDSIKGEAGFDLYLLHMHLLEWAMTNGAQSLMREFHHFDIPVPFDIEFSIGSNWSNKTDWDWSTKSLHKLLYASLKDHNQLYGLNEDPKQTIKQMKGSFREQSRALNLHDRYPLNTEVNHVKAA